MGSCMSSNISIHKLNKCNKYNEELDKYKDTTMRNLELEFEICKLEKLEDSLNEKINNNIKAAASYIERNLVEVARNRIKENVLYKTQLDIIGSNRLSLIRMKNNTLLNDMNIKVYEIIKGNNSMLKDNSNNIIEECEIYEREEEINQKVANVINSKNEFNEKEIDYGLKVVVNMLNNANNRV